MRLKLQAWNIEREIETTIGGPVDGVDDLTDAIVAGIETTHEIDNIADTQVVKWLEEVCDLNAESEV